MKSRRGFNITRSTPASLPLEDLVTKHTSVKWTIGLRVDEYDSRILKQLRSQRPRSSLLLTTEQRRMLSDHNRKPVTRNSKVVVVLNLWGGTRGRETGRKGGGRCTGGGRRGGGKRDSQGSGKREKKGKITQHCAIFRNRINAKGWEPKNTGREPGLKGTGSGRFKPPCPPPPPLIWYS